MYYTTGFHGDEIVELAAMVHAVPMVDGKSWPPILGLFKSGATDVPVGAGA